MYITGIEANFLLFALDAYLGVDENGHLKSTKHGYSLNSVQALRDSLFRGHKHPEEPKSWCPTCGANNESEARNWCTSDGCQFYQRAKME